jgi:ketosteroid isomerase-like protein
MPPDSVEIIRSFHQAFAAQDKERFTSFLSPAIEWTSAENFIYADHSPYRGIPAVLDLIFRRIQEDWDGFSMTAGEILGGDGLVILSGRFHGVFRANGVRVNAQMVQVFQLVDGKIAKVQVYTDTAQFKEVVNQIRHAGV